MKPRIRSFLLPVVALVVFVSAAFYAADLIAESERAKALVGSFGIFGVILIAMLAGINIGMPIPAASFTPVFEAAGMELATIIIGITLGITITDSINYLIGRYGRLFSEEHYPKFYKRLKVANERHQKWILPGVFVYAAAVPFPNEAILIPLGLIGYRYRSLIIPLILGNAISQSILVFAFSGAYQLLF